MRNRVWSSKAISILLAALLVLSAFPLSVFGVIAESAILDGIAQTAALEGEDSSGEEAPEFKLNEENYYEIWTAEHLGLFRNLINSNSNTSANAKLMADIDLEGLSQSPIGNNTYKYNGTFDGNGFSVKNLTINSGNNDLGFFGSTAEASSIKNLTIESALITAGSDLTGAIAGVHRGALENCHVKGIKLTAPNGKAGGLVGQFQGSLIKDCSVTGVEGMNTVYALNSAYCGGIVGYVNSASVSFVNCSVSGLDIRANNRIGGIYGDGTAIVNLTNCHVNDCSMTANERIGGLGFGMRNGSTITSCTVTDVIMRTTSTAANPSESGVAGLIAYIYSGNNTISDCLVDGLDVESRLINIGGAIGGVNSRVDVYHTVVKNIKLKNTITAVTSNVFVKAAGFVGNITAGASYFYGNGVENAEIICSNSSGETQAAGFVGNVQSNTVNTFNLCYAANISFNAAGTHVGGFMGRYEAADHVISESYASISEWNNTRVVNTGKFIGNRNRTGNIANCFAADPSNHFLVGSTNANNQGTITGISEVTPANVANGQLAATLNNINSVWVQSPNGYPVLDRGDAAPMVMDSEGYYLIYNAYQLNWYRFMVNSNANTSIKGKLMADIDLKGIAVAPIGNDVRKFNGTFDGNNFTIKNLKVNESGNDKGLFGSTTNASAIRNVNIENAEITAAYNAGALAGVIRGVVENCHVTGVKITATNTRAAALVGAVANGATTTMRNCSATGVAEGGWNTVTSANSHAAGILGYFDNVSLYNFYDCKASGLIIKANGGDGRVGGIYSEGSGVVNLTNCHVRDCELTAVARIGGLGYSIKNGSAVSASTVTNLIAKTTAGGGEIGGLFGYTTGNTNSIVSCTVDNAALDGSTGNGGNVGGAIGLVTSITNITNTIVKNSSIKSYTFIGGFVGQASGGTSTFNKDAVVNTSITSTAANNVATYAGGFIGSFPASNNVNTIKFSYAADITMNVAGTYSGGFIGRSSNANHVITDCYSSIKEWNNAQVANMGTFIGNRAQGNFTNCYTASASSHFLAGGSNATTQGTITNITSKTRAEVADGTLNANLNSHNDIWMQSAANYPVIDPDKDPDLTVDANGYYLIRTVEHLKQFRDIVNAGNLTANARVGANINLGGAIWDQIGRDDRRYNGHFDGQGFTISNFTVSNTAYDRGLFGKSNPNAVFENINIANVTISGNRSHTGTLVGFAEGSTIKNCHVTGVNVNSTNNNQYAGGLVGVINAGAKLIDCSVTGVAGMKTVRGTTQVGGIVGRIDGDNCSIINCDVTNLDIIITADCAGGIYGENNSKSNLTIRDCDVKDVAISCTRYAGGIGFSTRNGSNTTNCTVENLTITASSGNEVGGLYGVSHTNTNYISDCSLKNITIKCNSGSRGAGAVGYVGSGNTLYLSNVNADGVNVSVTGQYAGGIIGMIDGRVEINNTHLKNATVTGPDRIGGMCGNLRGGSRVTNSSVTNATINSTVSATGNEVSVGGFVGLCGWDQINYMTNCLANNITINAVGMRVGGFIGKIDTVAHVVNHCYANNVTINSNAASNNTGSFIGSRMSGTYANCFSVVPVYPLLVGSDVSGLNGDIGSINLIKIDLSIIQNAETSDLIKYYLGGRDFLNALNNTAQFIKDALMGISSEMNAYLDAVIAELSTRLESAIDEIIAVYEANGSKVDLQNFKALGKVLKNVPVEIYTNNIPLDASIAPKYNRYLLILEEYNAYKASGGLPYEKTDVDYPVRHVMDNDVVKTDDYNVSEDGLLNIIDKLDKILLGEDFANLVGLDSTLDATLTDLLNESLYNNNLINTIVQALYPMVNTELKGVVTSASESLSGIASWIVTPETISGILDSVVNNLKIAIYPNSFAAMLPAKYATVKSILNTAGTDWSGINWEDLDWGITNRADFVEAFGWALKGIEPIARPLITGLPWTGNTSVPAIVIATVDVTLKMPAVNVYKNILMPVYELLGITGFATEAQVNLSTITTNTMANYILNPLLDWVEGPFLDAPISTIASIIPNLAYWLEWGLVDEMLDILKISLDYSLHASALFGCIGVMDAADRFEISLPDLLINDEGGLLYGADLTSITGILNTVLGVAGLDFELPEINNARLAAMGDSVTVSPLSGQPIMVADKAKTLYTVLEYILSIIGDEDLIRNVFAMVNDVPADEVEVDELIATILGGLSADPGSAIAAIVELCNPVEYQMREINYDRPGSGTGQSAPLYSNYWTRDKAKYVVNNLDGFVDNVLELLGLDSVEIMLNDLLGDQLFTNKNLASLVLLVKDLVSGLGSAGDKIFELLKIDLSPWDGIEEGHNFGFNDGDKNGFIDAFCETVAPVNNLIALLLADRDFSILDGQITAKGYEGYKYGVIPILEALGCDPADIVSGANYLAHYYGDDESGIAGDGTALIKDIVTPVFNLLEKAFDDPVYTVFEILPEIICFVESGALSDALKNTLQSAFALLDTVRPIYDLEINLDFNLSSIVAGLLGSLTGDSGFVIPADFDLRNFASDAPEDVLTVILRYVVQIVFHDDNYGLIAQAISEQNNFTADETKTLMAAFDALRSIAIGLNGEDIDMVLYVLYYIFYGLNIGSGSTLDFLNNFNASWKALMDMLLGSDSDIVNGFGKVLKDTLNKYFGGIFDEGGLGSDGALTFFQKIAAFFQKIIDFFKNLFN